MTFPPDAEVTLGSWLKINLGNNWLVRPGDHLFLVSAAGYNDLAHPYQVTDARIQKLQLSLTPLPGDLEIILTPENTGEIFIDNNSSDIKEIKKINNLSFKILQAARVRVTSTDFISCPSCGRTLFNLQETTAIIRERTDHLKGLKIGIMGCIVNGPGEMADADYGYVGSGKDKITLYRGQDVVKRGINFKYGVDELVNLIKEDGNWIEP